MILKDMSNLEICEETYISEATVKKHISNIYKKCAVSSRDMLRVLISKISTGD